MQGAMLSWRLEPHRALGGRCKPQHGASCPMFLEFAGSGTPAIHGWFPRGTH